MDIDDVNLNSIIKFNRYPEEFGAASDSGSQLGRLCVGDDPCCCFSPLQDGPREQVTPQAILEREIEEEGSSFTTKDNISSIGGFQTEQISSEGNLGSMPAPDVGANKQMKESPLTPAAMECETSLEVISSDFDTMNPISTENSIPGAGKFQIEQTRSDGFWCGVYALEISTNKQLAGDTLTPADFHAIFTRDADMRAFNQLHGFQNRKEFHDEQLACVLRIWGRQRGYERLQLGVFGVGGLCYILGADDKLVVVDSEAAVEKETNELGFTIIWIHNNNAMQLHGAAINHYSGVTLLEMNEEQSKANAQRAAKRKETAEKKAVVKDRLQEIRKPRESARGRKLKLLQRK